MRFPLGVSGASFFLFNMWPCSWLYCSMRLPCFQHIVNVCQCFEWKLVTALQQKLKDTLHKQCWSMWGQRSLFFHPFFSFSQCLSGQYLSKRRYQTTAQFSNELFFTVWQVLLTSTLTNCSVMGISRGHLLLALFYCAALQSISNAAASAEPINHLARLLKQIAAS